MNYRHLGRTGLLVSELCLGAMTFGRETGEEDSQRILDRFVEAGGNYIDTADVYSAGLSEQILGRWLKGKNRENLVIATKVRFRTGPGQNDIGLGRKHITAAIEASLRRLGTGYVDLYQTHMWDAATPLEETLSALDGLVRAGKVRYLGASNIAGYQLQQAIDLSRANGWEAYTCLQPLYNLLDRAVEWELLPVCMAQGVGVAPWSPLRGGWLSGKYRAGMSAPPAGSRVEQAERENWSERWSEYANERTWNVVETLFTVSEELGRTPAQVALNWLLRRPGVTAPIIGVRTMAQLENNLGAVGWELPQEQLERLNQASQAPLPYPYNLLNA